MPARFSGTGIVSRLLPRVVIAGVTLLSAVSAAFARPDPPAIVGQVAPELNFEWSSVPGLKRLSDLRGRVVVLDFWTTWCGPCLASFPGIREEVTHFAGSPVTILGVTGVQGSVFMADRKQVDAGSPEREYELTAQFLKEMNVTWPVVFSREKVFNPDYAVKGIPRITLIAPDGKVRANDLRPDQTQRIQKLIMALLQEFKLPAPTSRH